MIADYGYVVDGVTYDKTEVTYNPETKSFKKSGDYTVSSWGAKNVEAYVVTKDGRRYSASTTVHITGLPYTLNIAANDGNWSQSGNVAWNESSAVRLGYYQWSGTASITNSSFVLPNNVNVQVVGNGIVSGTGSIIKVENEVSISVSGTKIFSDKQKGQSNKTWTCNGTGTMTSSNPSVTVNSSYNLEKAMASVKALTIKYGNK
jgi:hypothetical protein